MAIGVKGLIDLGLQSQIARLRRIAEDYKDRAILAVKQKIVSIGITVGLAVVGLLFLLIALCVGLAALYLWIAQQYGPFVGLGAVGGLTLGVALLLFAIVAFRGGSSSKTTTVPTKTPIKTATAVTKALRAAGDAADKAGASAKSAEQAVRHAMDEAVDTVRTGPREAVFATLAATVLLGVFLGRRR